MAHIDKRIGGTPWHIQDCHVWAEIRYLDSPTDYRECLPGRSPVQECANDGLILLDSPSPSLSAWIIHASVIVGIILLFSGGYFLYLLLAQLY